MRATHTLLVTSLCSLALIGSSNAQQPDGDPTLTEVWDPEPSMVIPGNAMNPPSDAIVLFDGSNLSSWQHGDGSTAQWRVHDGAFTVAGGSGDIQTRQSFGSIQLHMEWRTPAVIEGDGQGRGNSGVFLQKVYEVQVLDSYRNRTYANGQAASVYKQYIPLVNASKGPGEWQTFDILFAAPQFHDDGSLLHPAYITVLHNNVLVQNHVELLGPTLYIGDTSYSAHPAQVPLLLQDHGNPVSYRNVWLRELADD